MRDRSIDGSPLCTIIHIRRNCIGIRNSGKCHRRRRRGEYHKFHRGQSRSQILRGKFRPSTSTLNCKRNPRSQQLRTERKGHNAQPNQQHGPNAWNLPCFAAAKRKSPQQSAVYPVRIRRLVYVVGGVSICERERERGGRQTAAATLQTRSPFLTEGEREASLLLLPPSLQRADERCRRRRHRRDSDADAEPAKNRPHTASYCAAGERAAADQTSE